MSTEPGLPPHLHPQTYWEKRCEVLETLVAELMQGLAKYNPAMTSGLQRLADDWGKTLETLGKEHPPPLLRADVEFHG